ncbi:hydrogenase expression/formation protein [Thioalkalivibrio denitrificans]|uniref:Hydrogenase expression/formation protein n=1 Tax=Thioalkalivibrio denitrificans TaxID=108003 RepID=A0A1V3NBJ7_9GAMM|nr:hydrogenase expression/formation protein [Thioalkalivibrio denitrificans]OOG22440.1 hydrogenase expression/formation protein [Thioalkalivibrio denitrificans]
MSGLDQITVRVESPDPDGADDILTGMADALLREIHAHLADLHLKGENHTIDLNGLPLTEADRRQLKAALGQGEVRIHVECAGPSEVYETAYAGVWWVDHRNGLGASAVQHIEIARTPAIVPAHPDDIADAVVRLEAALKDAAEQD